MDELKSVSKVVKRILETDPQTRNSDSFLYLKVAKCYARANGFASFDKIPVTVFLEHMGAWKFPPFESVRRARQKIQAEYPELAACDRVSAMRSEKVSDYRAFARSDV